MPLGLFSTGEPQRIPGVSHNVSNPVILPASGGRPSRLAFEYADEDINIWRVPLREPGKQSLIEPVHPQRFLASTRLDLTPFYSNDGTRVAFTSDRSGQTELWVSDSDGSRLMQITELGGYNLGTPRWSPDARYIAFDSHVAGNSDVYVVRAEGGIPRQLTPGKSEEARPSWSKDGKWIYFRSNRSGRQEIWRTPAGGGQAEQITKNGGFEAFESSVGNEILYVKSRTGSGLWSMPLSGGPERQIVPGVYQSYWNEWNGGIYFVDFDGADAAAQTFPIRFYNLSDAATSVVGEVRRQLPRTTPCFGVTPDGRFALVCQYDNQDTDIMSLDYFR